jgi:hypothetical protein
MSSQLEINFWNNMNIKHNDSYKHRCPQSIKEQIDEEVKESNDNCVMCLNPKCECEKCENWQCNKTTNDCDFSYCPHCNHSLYCKDCYREREDDSCENWERGDDCRICHKYIQTYYEYNDDIYSYVVGDEFLLYGEYVEKVNNRYEEIGDGKGQLFETIVKVTSVGKKKVKLFIDIFNKTISFDKDQRQIGRIIHKNKKYYFDYNLEYKNLQNRDNIKDRGFCAEYRHLES